MKRSLKFVGFALILIGSLAATTIDNDKYFEITKNIEIFVNVYKQLNFNYVDEIDPGELMRIGIDAMVGSLDPYTNYISENQVERYRINTDNKYNGTGAVLSMVDDYYTVLEAFEDSPALEAGLIAGDQIRAIDGLSTYQKPLDDLNRIIRGAPGTDVNLSIYRPSTKESLEVVLTRGDVAIPNVPYSGIVRDNVGYIKLTTFTGGASKNIGKALNDLKEEDENLKGVIIDLRDNGGGLLIEAVDICGLFLPSNTLVVSNKGKVKDRDQSFKTRRAPMDVDIPIAVLINKSSASASEIVSGTLQDYDRGVLLGQRSFGKGLVQNTQEVGYNNRVKLTTSKYYIPSGRCIQGVEYDKGVPVDIPDERRSKFKTKNGRTVLDGGGVTPDVKLPAKEEGELLKALKEQHIIFKFVNEFVAKKDSISAAGSFQFEDYKSFTEFVKKIGFTYQTQAEKDMDQLKASTSEAFNKELKSLSQKIEKEKEAAFEKEKADIIKEIEQSIVGRYYFQAGKAHQALNNDSEVLEAIRILTTPSEYKAILK